MLKCLVPTDRERVDYRLYVKNKRDYDIAVASGVGFLAYYNLPVDWRVAEEEIKEFNQHKQNLLLSNDEENGK